MTGDGRVRVVAVFAALNLAAVAAYLAVAFQFGFFNHMSDSVFWAPDSHTYSDVGHWLLGAAPNPAESAHRPFLYPLLLALSEKVAGAPGIWSLNLVCWFGMLNLTAVAVRRLTGRLAIAAVAFLVLAANASLIVLSFQALTETLTTFLESAWIVGLALSPLPPARPREIAMILLPLSLLVVVKPEFQIQLLVAVVLLVITVWRLPRGRAILAAAGAACLIPVLFQLGLMITANHLVGVSNSGDIELKGYFVSQVYASLNGLPDDLVAARNVVGPWTTRHAIEFLLEHRGLTARTFVDNLHRNLTSGSNFVDPSQHPWLAELIRNTNRTYLKVHVAFLPIVLIAIWRRRDVRLVLLYVFAALVTVLSSLIVDQGDRYIEVALPLWAAAYGIAVADLLPDLSNAIGRWRPKPRAA